MVGYYVLKLDENGNLYLYDEDGGERLVCRDIYSILDYVKSHGSGTIYVSNTIVIKGGVIR